MPLGAGLLYLFLIFLEIWNSLILLPIHFIVSYKYA